MYPAFLSPPNVLLGGDYIASRRPNLYAARGLVSEPAGGVFSGPPSPLHAFHSMTVQPLATDPETLRPNPALSASLRLSVTNMYLGVSSGEFMTLIKAMCYFTIKKTSVNIECARKTLVIRSPMLQRCIPTHRLQMWLFRKYF